METFVEKLLLLLVDKLALALVALIVGYFINRALVHYRSNQAIREEMEKQRVERVAPLWQELNALHYLVTHRYHLEGLTASEEELEKLKSEVTDKETTVILNARNNSFWLGRELFRKQMQYLESIRQLKDEINHFRAAVRSGGDIGARGEEMKKALERAMTAFLDIDDVLGFLMRKHA